MIKTIYKEWNIKENINTKVNKKLKTVETVRERERERAIF